MLRYCGEYFDAETGTIYLRARYYNPTTGRFISRDSVTGDIDDPLSLNLYTYCANNPILYVDPSGNFAEEIYGFFSEAQQFLSNSWETVKGYGGSIASSVSSNAHAYGGCATATEIDGPAPFVDILAASAAVVITGYCVYEGVKTYNDATVLPRGGTFTKGKALSLDKVKKKAFPKA